MFSDSGVMISRSVRLMLLTVGVLRALEINDASALNYLQKYGYLPKSQKTASLLSKQEFVSKLKSFQEFAGLPVTGELDAATVKKMQAPRCGVRDDFGKGRMVRRRKRYSLADTKWPSTTLTYRITGYTKKLDKTEVDKAIERAFKVWSDVSRLNFTRTSGEPDIEIYFAVGEHGDGGPFDGPSATLAHAFFPGHGGDAHFDDAESWTVESSEGIDLFQVATHEFGHSLGLGHSEEQNAIMAPFYRPNEPNVKLDWDDIIAIQINYGAPLRPTTGPVPPPPVPSTPSAGSVAPDTIPSEDEPFDICRNSTVDAVTRMSDGSTYVFVGILYYRLNNAGIDSGYPRRISSDWFGVKGPIDAALTASNGHTYLFKGSQYWDFVNKGALFQLPRQIGRGFKGIPDNLTAAFTWSGDGHIYFIKDSVYYKYYLGYGVAPGYPRPLTVWKGLPGKIDAAVQWQNRRTYLFSGNNYYMFNDTTLKVDAGYPRNISYWWFRCATSGHLGQDINREEGSGTTSTKANLGRMHGVVTSGGSPIDFACVTIAIYVLGRLVLELV